MNKILEKKNIVFPGMYLKFLFKVKSEAAFKFLVEFVLFYLNWNINKNENIILDPKQRFTVKLKRNIQTFIFQVFFFRFSYFSLSQNDEKLK